MIHPVECGVDLPSSGTGDDGAIEADNPGGQLWHRQRLIDPNAGRCRVFVGISEWGYHLPVVRFDFEREVWVALNRDTLSVAGALGLRV